MIRSGAILQLTRRVSIYRSLNTSTHRRSSETNDTEVGLKDFFRPENERLSFEGDNEYRPGLAWSPDMLNGLTIKQLHELWYILLREKNIINTEKYHAWKSGKSYQVTHDPEEVICESMANVKKRLKDWNNRAAVINGKLGSKHERRIRMTNMYDTNEGGTVSELETSKEPHSWEQPEHFPENPNTHFIDQYYPQAIEQPVEIAFNGKIDWDKMQLKEDRYMQEHLYWAKVQNLWDVYVSKQKSMLSEREYEFRVEEDFYPNEMPAWWRKRHSHENMWKYGIWPQHSIIAKREELSKYQSEKIPMARRDIRMDSQPDYVIGTE